MPDTRGQVEEAVAFIRGRSDKQVRIGLVLGSGLSPLVEALADADKFPTQDIPHWPRSTVEGHKGEILLGTLAGVSVAVLKGRVHAYEGYDLGEVTFPVRVLARLGIRALVLTNAAGGINKDFGAGDLMIIADHLNLQCASPLRGPNVKEWGPRFPDMSEVYDAKLRTLAKELALLQEIEVHEGVYASMPGPQYETPAEVRMLKILGADAVGMSTVPEAIVARHMSLKVLGFSVISNLAAGIADHPLSHEEVMEAGARMGPMFSAYLQSLLPRIDQTLETSA